MISTLTFQVLSPRKAISSGHGDGVVLGNQVGAKNTVMEIGKDGWGGNLGGGRRWWWLESIIDLRKVDRKGCWLGHQGL